MGQEIMNGLWVPVFISEIVYYSIVNNGAEMSKSMHVQIQIGQKRITISVYQMEWYVFGRGREVDKPAISLMLTDSCS